MDPFTVAIVLIIIGILFLIAEPSAQARSWSYPAR